MKDVRISIPLHGIIDTIVQLYAYHIIRVYINLYYIMTYLIEQSYDGLAIAVCRNSVSVFGAEEEIFIKLFVEDVIYIGIRSTPSELKLKNSLRTYWRRRRRA